MKIYMVWVHDWPHELVFVTEKKMIEGEHNPQKLVYKYQSPTESRTEYYRDPKMIRELIDFFELEPDIVKEINL